MNLNSKNFDNIIITSIGAGMFLWVSMLSLLYLFVDIILKTLLIIARVDSLLTFWINEVIFIILFSIITFRIFAWIKNKPIEMLTALRILRYSIILLIITSASQFVLRYFVSGLVTEKFPLQFNAYNDATTSAYLMTIQAGLHFVLYLFFGILVYRK